MRYLLKHITHLNYSTLKKSINSIYYIVKYLKKDNGELLQLSGLRSPYPGKLGVVEEKALADLLLVDGNPLKDLALITNPEKNFLVIIKDGQVFKNTLKGKK